MGDCRLWQAQPIFISSTFVDMQAERDHLRLRVFPELEERLKALRRHLTWVDLRIGVATGAISDAEERELHVLKVCLGEVRRCVPFLIVLLGDRYGWVPPPERIARAAGEEGVGFAVNGLSVTDLEIRFGVLEERQESVRSYFYFRDPLPYHEMRPSLAAVYSEARADDPNAKTRALKLSALKGAISERLPARVRRYAAGWDAKAETVTDLEAWGRTVLEDIWSEFEREFASGSETPLSWQEAERIALDDFIEDRARDFIGRETLLVDLTLLATSSRGSDGPWGICLAGEPGSGKSAIFGAVLRRLRDPNVLVLAHAAGASARAPSVDDMLLRWIEQIERFIGLEPRLKEGAGSESIQATFHALLERASEEYRVVVVVDGLDQFENTIRGRLGTWLPQAWPENARLIATCIPGEASNALARRSGVRIESMPVLEPGEGQQIVAGICTRYRRTLEPEVVQALVTKPGERGLACHNVLWLVLAVEELNLVDADDFSRAASSAFSGAPEQRLRSLLLEKVGAIPTNVPDLYAASFDHAVKMFGEFLTRAFLGAIAVSRGGWRESDFRALLPRLSHEEWDQLRFASLRRLFRGQVRQRGALQQWDFTHSQMRFAVDRFLKTLSIAPVEIHAEVVAHLKTLPADDPLRESECMVHLLGSEDYSGAANYYGGEDLMPGEVAGSTRVLVDIIITAREAGNLAAVERMIDSLSVENVAASKIAEHVGYRFNSYITDHAKGRATLEAQAVVVNALRRAHKRFVARDRTTAVWKRELAHSSLSYGAVLFAQGELEDALDQYTVAQSILHNLIESDPDDTGYHQALSVCNDQIGAVLRLKGDLPGALDTHRQAAALFERLAQSKPESESLQHQLSVSTSHIGDILQALGRLDDAFAARTKCLAILAGLLKISPGSPEFVRAYAISEERLGDILLTKGNVGAAMEQFRVSGVMFAQLVSIDPRNAEWQHDLGVSHQRMADCLFHYQRDPPGALLQYRAAHAASERAAAADPGNANWRRSLIVSHNKIGDVLLAISDGVAAQEHVLAALAIASQLAQAQPQNMQALRDVASCHRHIGDLKRSTGDTEAACASYSEALGIIRRVVEVEPGNTEALSELYFIHAKTGEVLAENGDHERAIASDASALAILHQLAVGNPANTRLQSIVTGVQVHSAIQHLALGQVATAHDELQSARSTMIQLVKGNPASAEFRATLSVVEENLGDVFSRQGKLKAALTSYATSLALSEQVTDARDNRRERLMLTRKMGGVLLEQGNDKEAFNRFSECLSLAKELASFGNEQAQADLAMCNSGLGRSLQGLGRREEARDLYAIGEEMLASLVARSTNPNQWRPYLTHFRQLIENLEPETRDGP